MAYGQDTGYDEETSLRQDHFAGSVTTWTFGFNIL